MPSYADDEQGYKEVHRRLVQSGEWDRILGVLVRELNESGWMDETHHRGKEAARTLEPFKFSALLDKLELDAQVTESVPPAIKKEIVTLLEHFLEKQFDH